MTETRRAIETSCAPGDPLRYGGTALGELPRNDGSMVATLRLKNTTAEQEIDIVRAGGAQYDSAEASLSWPIGVRRRCAVAS